MLEHIVKNGEVIQDILNMYHIELDELMSYNLHITDFYNLASGMKIKIPLLHNEVEQILENTESFVQKYYPKVHDLFEEKKELSKTEMRVEEIIEEDKEEAPSHSPKPLKVEPKGKPYPGILPPKYPKRG
ncbi:MAG: LysM peptidoglycan-binding domain-containing protein [Anaeroplasmataceae bacterium]|nr:LysM peptidoglycan-binding domain-containing protein [Anaeroplasmataceae bacterium]